ncbi:hypothetical protein K3495_g4236 [Podosphaera aphanis]|nr:hypothetical protein K3495_g4236 [Podosphaera aphanis]
MPKPKPKPKPKKAPTTISKIVETDSEAELDAEPVADLSQASKTVGRKMRARPKVPPAKTAKPSSTATRTSDRVTVNAKLTKASSSNSKKDVSMGNSTQNNRSKFGDIDDFLSDDPMVEVSSSIQMGKQKSAQTKLSKKNPSISHNPNDKSPEIQQVATNESQKKRGRSNKEISPEISREKIIMETQVVQPNLDESSDEIVEQTVKNSAGNSLPQDTYDSDSRNYHASFKRPRLSASPYAERISDSNLRRGLDDLSEKYENLKKRYQDLVELGLKEAERNFDKLKKKTSEDLLISMKADLAVQKAIAKEVQDLKTQIDSQKVETNSLQAKLHQTENKLAETQAENKILSAKLAANRTTAVSVESVGSKVPGSAIKVNGGIRMVGTAEAAQTAQAAQLKEDLYSDLTGLIMRSVTRGVEEDCFDCIQTGRNGTLHFKLATGNEKSADSYDDIQCSYTPLLDPSRDKALIEILPDYLAEDITFPRPYTAKFYARVFKALTEEPLPSG